MSSAFAIAGVTAFLMDLLNDGLTKSGISAVVGGPPKLSAQAPFQISAGGAGLNQLNIFLYQVNPNPGWRNQGLPSRDPSGQRVSNPPLALDLVYMMTAYEAVDLNAEILLGHAMQLLHEVPAMSRDQVRGMINNTTAGQVKTVLQDSELVEQLEQIKISPHYLATEEMSKLWSAFSAPYHPSMAYQVSVVLIEAHKRTRPTRPVLERRVHVQPFDQPVIDDVLSQTAAGQPVLTQPILPGHILVLQGQHLMGQETQMRVAGQLVAPLQVSTTEVRVALTELPFVAGSLRAGVLPAQVMHQLNFSTPTEPHQGFDSNVATFVLRPIVAAGAISNRSSRVDNGVTLVSGELTITFTPLVGREQRVMLLLDGLDVDAALRLAAPDQNGITNPAQVSTAQIRFAFKDVPTGHYLMRAQVDGAESLVALDPGGHTFNSPAVNIA